MDERRLGLSNVLLCIMSLLVDPNAESPVNPDVAAVLTADRCVTKGGAMNR